MKIMVIDGNSIINRAFYGIRTLTNAEGLNTNAIYGFLSIYFKIREEVEPDGVCVAFDLKKPTFRHLKYEAYKAGRKGMPDELAEQIEPMKQVLDAMNIMRIECEGFEADDIIGTVSKVCEKNGDECVIVTGDRDSFQLIENEGTQVLLVSSRMGKTETTLYNGAELLMKYGLPPELMKDLKGLMGDSSDNIPGVPGIGEKTATELVSKFGNIDSIYENIDSPEIRDSVRRKLCEGKDLAYLSKWLGTIACDAPIDFSVEKARLREVDNDRLYELFSKLEFKSYITRMGLKIPEKMPAKENAQKTQEKEYSKKIINTENDFEEAKERLSGKRAAVICDDAFSGIGVLCEDEVYLACRFQCGEDVFKSFMRLVFSDAVEKTLHDKKEFTARLKKENTECKNVVFDTALAAYVIDATRKRYDIVSVSHMLGCDIDIEWDRLSDPVSFSPLTGCEDGINALFECAKTLCRIECEERKKLSEASMEALYFDIEAPFTDVLSDMEKEGVLVDVAELKTFGDKLSNELSDLTKSIYALAGEEFNILSPKQLGEVLFEHLGIPPVKKTKTGYSTDADVLAKIAGYHEIIPLIIEYRKYSKLKSTYADGLLRFISPDDGKIHTTYQQMVTATGRISSTDPNLQNIPVRTELGGEMRKMFVPSEGNVFIDADYSQIELRVLAHISGDKEMCDAFINGTDIHSQTASQIFGISVDEVGANERRVAKAVNFGIVYGISEFSLAEDIGVSRFEAKRYIETYLERFSGVRNYMKDVVEKAKANGYVTTLFGRRRYIPEITSKNFNVRSFGERVALNAPIQGSAADIIKIAMIKVKARLEKENISAKLILQVHDELIIEASEKDAEYVAKMLTEEMENACSLAVPLTADAGIGKTWYEAKK